MTTARGTRRAGPARLLLFGLGFVLMLALMLVLGLAVPAAIAGPGGADPDPGVREPAVAGQFYPADPAGLQEAVTAFLADAVRPAGPRPVALVAPHAGYIYSGQIAADAYRQALGGDYDLVVILGTNHTTSAFTGASVYPGGGYRTPLGVARIDEEAASALAARDPAFSFRAETHAREHSVEVQVPFVQTLFPGVPILAAVVGAPDVDLCRRLGKAIAEVVAGRRPLIVASCDLSHYPGYEAAVAADHATLTAMASLDANEVEETIRRQMLDPPAGLSTCACGQAPVMAAIEAAHRLGATRARVVSYANSGDTALGDRSRVVGYGAMVFEAAEGGPDLTGLAPEAVAPDDAPLGEWDQRALLAHARETIQRYLTTGTAPLARGFSPVLNRKQGVFVTLKKRGILRGCVGHTGADLPVAQVVGAMALQAAFNDRRFQPLGIGELNEIVIDISLLTPFRRIASAEEIVLGRDGVLLRKLGASAIFLPEVAVEQGWDRDTMLRRLSQKAGLPPDAWKSDAELRVFETVVFHEEPDR